MKKNLPLLVLVTASLAACGGGAGFEGLSSTSSAATLLAESGSTPPAGTPSSSPGATSPSADSSQYLSTAYQDGLGEIELSQLALDRASNRRVKTFAQQMIEQHTAANNEITQLAQQKNISLPTTLSADQQAEVNRLSALTGDEFDLAYMQLNVTTHERDVTDTKAQAKQGTDPDVMRFAQATLPILKTHLGIAEEILGVLDPSAFLVRAYQDGLAEIQLAQLTLQKSSNDTVRGYAQRMIDDHTQANSQITTLAQQKTISLPGSPTTEQQETANELATFAGADFDKAYMDHNVIVHALDVRQFRQQANQGRDPDIQELAKNNRSVLMTHLITAIEIDQSIQPSFLFSAFQDGQAELALSHLAVQRATNADVKAFAQRMIDDHATANMQIMQLAQQKGVALPTELSPEQSLIFVEMLRLSGQNFDRGYMAYSVRIHEKDVSKATTQSEQGTDPDIKSFAQSILPVLTEHLTTARTLASQVNAASQTSPGAGGGTGSTGTSGSNGSAGTTPANGTGATGGAGNDVGATGTTPSPATM